MSNDSFATVALWEDLQGYMVTKMELGAPEVVTDNNRQYEACKVIVTVSNTAPDDPDFPRIVFMGVGLSVADLKRGDRGDNVLPKWAKQVQRPGTGAPPPQGVGPKYLRLFGGGFPEITSDENQHGDVLFPGQTVTYMVNVPTSDIPYFKFRVEGTVSRRHLFHYQHGLPMPNKYTLPPILTALQAFNAIDIHKTLDSILRSMPSFGPDTRLADLQVFRDFLLSDAPEEIKATQVALGNLRREAPNPSILEHVKGTLVYLVLHLGAACKRMEEAISSSNSEEMAAAAEDMKALQVEANEINRATEKQMDSYGFSDEEANYRYRGR